MKLVSSHDSKIVNQAVVNHRAHMMRESFQYGAERRIEKKHFSRVLFCGFQGQVW